MNKIEDLQNRAFNIVEESINRSIKKQKETIDEEIKYVDRCIREASDHGKLSTTAGIKLIAKDAIINKLECEGFFFIIDRFISAGPFEKPDSCKFHISWKPKDIIKAQRQGKFMKVLRHNSWINPFNVMASFFYLVILTLIIMFLTALAVIIVK